jgi:hemerythrin
MHSSEHVQALQQLSAVQVAWEETADREALRGYIQTWRQWLQQHIASMDFVTAQFLSQFPIPNDLTQIDELREHDTH